MYRNGLYLCAKFRDFIFSRFGFIVRTDAQTESHTESLRRMISILTRLLFSLY